MEVSLRTRTGGTIHQMLGNLGGGDIAANALRIVAVFAVAFVITRLVPRACRRLIRSLQLHGPTRLASPRADTRATTVGAVLASIFRSIVWVIAFLTALGSLGINLGPFVATATVIGAAVGFGAQSLVKDFLSGLLILIEDQYGVGDSITVGDVSGTVEGVNLRTTRIRSLDGVVWYVANGEIRKVGNSSEGYNQAVVDVVVPVGTDLARAEQLAGEEAQALASEVDWRDVILEPPAVLGVQAVAADGVTIRVMAKTTAGAHFRVARELRARISERLRREGVAWAAAGPGQASSDGADGPSSGSDGAAVEDAASAPAGPASPVSPGGAAIPPVPSSLAAPAPAPAPAPTRPAAAPAGGAAASNDGPPPEPTT
jgi:small-conductance mechanosensitive channel